MSAKCWSIYWLILNWHIDRVCWHVDWHRSPHDRHACLTILGWHLADTLLTLFSQHYCHLAAPFTELHLLYSNINLNSLTLRNFLVHILFLFQHRKEMWSQGTIQFASWANTFESSRLVIGLKLSSDQKVAYVFATFEWNSWRLRKDSTSLWIVLE